jgi:hypothetical protein
VVVDLVDVIHQTEMVETVIIILHRILVLVVVLLMVELVEVVTHLVVVLHPLLMQEEVVVGRLLEEQILHLVMVVTVEQVIKLHGFLLTYHLCSVNQDHHQESGTAVEVEVVRDQVQMEDLVEVIQMQMIDMLGLVLAEENTQTMVHMQIKMLFSHPVVVELEELGDQMSSAVLPLI